MLKGCNSRDMEYQLKGHNFNNKNPKESISSSTVRFQEDSIKEQMQG